MSHLVLSQQPEEVQTFCRMLLYTRWPKQEFLFEKSQKFDYMHGLSSNFRLWHVVQRPKLFSQVQLISWFQIESAGLPGLKHNAKSTDNYEINLFRYTKLLLLVTRKK